MPHMLLNYNELHTPGADQENFSRGGGPTLSKIDFFFTYNFGSAQIWKITNFFISSNIGDKKLCKFKGGGIRTPRPPHPLLDPRMHSAVRCRFTYGSKPYAHTF